MAQHGLKKMVKQFEIKSDGDVFHEIFKSNPHHLTHLSPSTVKSCELHHGDLGTVGSIVKFEYIHDGQHKYVKHLIEAIDENKKLVVFRALEGDLLKLYKTFIISVHVETHGENNLVTWTIDYEKLKEDVEEPNTLMDFFYKMTKDIENHHLSSN